MIDFFSHAGLLAYRTNDFEVSYQWLRSAVNHRHPGKVNSWYFHIHDIGTLNLRDRHGEPVMIDEDGEDGPEPAVTAESLLQAHLDRIHDRYVTEGSVVWTDPVTLRRMLD